jgi:hypothetical protein
MPVGAHKTAVAGMIRRDSDLIVGRHQAPCIKGIVSEAHCGGSGTIAIIDGTLLECQGSGRSLAVMCNYDHCPLGNMDASRSMFRAVWGMGSDHLALLVGRIRSRSWILSAEPPRCD